MSLLQQHSLFTTSLCVSPVNKGDRPDDLVLHYQQLRNVIAHAKDEHPSNLDIIYRHLLILVKDALENPSELRTAISNLLPQLWDFRIAIAAAIPDLSKQHQAAMEKNYLRLKNVKGSEGLSLLSDSVCFACRLIYNTVESLNQMAKEVKQDISPAPSFFSFSYQQLRTIFAEVPNVGESLMDLLNSSMLAEVGLMVMVETMDEKMQPSEEALKVVAGIVNDAAQTYGACSRRLGFIKKKGSGRPVQFPENISEEELQNEYILAESGINEYLN